MDLESYRIYFNRRFHPNLPEHIDIQASDPTIAGIVEGKFLVEGDDPGDLIDSIYQIDPETNAVEDRHIDYDVYVDPYVIRRVPMSQAFRFNPASAGSLSKVGAWRMYLQRLQQPIQGRYTMQSEAVTIGPDNQEAASTVYQFDDPEFLQGIISVFNWAGLDWHNYLHPIFEIIRDPRHPTASHPRIQEVTFD
jgi:hypothetical protein